MAVHAPGQADLNLYAYVHGKVLVAVDPVGLCSSDECQPTAGAPSADNPNEPNAAQLAQEGQARDDAVAAGAHNADVDARAVAESRDAFIAHMRHGKGTFEERKAAYVSAVERILSNAESSRLPVPADGDLRELYNAGYAANLYLAARSNGVVAMAMASVPIPGKGKANSGRGTNSIGVRPGNATNPTSSGPTNSGRGTTSINDVGKTRLPRYDGAKPAYYVNPAHVPGPTKNPRKENLPADAAEVYRTAVPDSPKGAVNWYGKNKDVVIYRFSNANDGTAHFSGSSASPDGIRNITPYAHQRLEGK